eukprot:jgi/Astpho2/9853/Aster-03815
MQAISATLKPSPVQGQRDRDVSRRVTSRSSVQAHAHQREQGAAEVSRREVALAGLAAISLAAVRPAQAGLLGGPSDNDIYSSDTALLVEKVTSALTLPKDASNREQAFQEVKDKGEAWVAKYRKGGGFQGRPSFSNTYSAVNALAGHFNSYGLTAPVPKKRLDRIQKELEDADKLLKRGR